MNYTRGESKTDTIGGKYPIVRINGNLHYRTFNIEGTIHSLMDQEGYFTSRADIYKDNQSVYDKYNEKHNVQYTRDFVYEKFFKEKVKNFLFQNNAILLRTPSEGNIIVKLISTNFTPNAQLNYLIYNELLVIMIPKFVPLAFLHHQVLHIHDDYPYYFFLQLPYQLLLKAPVLIILLLHLLLV